MRHTHRPDTVQAEIVEGLRKAGYRVEIIGRPVDLLVGRTESVGEYSGTMNGQPVWLEHGKATKWKTLELKSPTKSGARRVRRDQASQDAFIAETGTPVVTSLTSALRALEGL